MNLTDVITELGNIFSERQLDQSSAFRAKELVLALKDTLDTDSELSDHSDDIEIFNVEPEDEED